MKYTFYFKKTIFFLFLLSEIGICSSAFAMFRDFFTDDEIMQAVVQRHIVRGEPAAEPDSLREDIGAFQAALATQDPRVFQPVVEAILSLSMHKTITEYINCLEGSHQGVGSVTDSLRFVMTGQEQEDDIKNKRAGRIFEMLDYYTQHSPLIDVKILNLLEYFVDKVYMIHTQRYTLQDLHLTLWWCMRLLDPPTSWVLSERYMMDQSTKESVVSCSGRIASTLLEKFRKCEMEASFIEDPYFERALTSAVEFKRKHEQAYYAILQVKEASNLNAEMICRFNSATITEHYFSGNRERHSDFMERLLPFYVRDNYVDYRLFNEVVRLPVVACKFERSEEEGLAYVLSVVNEQGVSFPITSEGVTEIRPPVDSAFAGVAYSLYKRKYIEELRALQRVPEGDRDYKTLHDLENSMELYKMLEIQGMVEFSLYSKSSIKLLDGRIQNRLRENACKEARARARAKQRQENHVGATKKPVGKNAPVVQAFPRATLEGYNVAGEYRGNKDGGSTSGIAASSAAASAASSSSLQSSEVKAVSIASTSGPRESLSTPLIILGSNHYDTFEAIMNGNTVTRSKFEGLLSKLQDLPKNHSASVSSRQAQDRSSGDHFFYSVRPIGESLRLDANAANQLRQTLNLSTDIEESENEINQLLEQLGLHSHRQGILLSGIGPQDSIPLYQIRQIGEHLESAGYTMQTVGKKR